MAVVVCEVVFVSVCDCVSCGCGYHCVWVYMFKCAIVCVRDCVHGCGCAYDCLSVWGRVYACMNLLLTDDTILRF
jgi:hypothetical protein